MQRLVSAMMSIAKKQIFASRSGLKVKHSKSTNIVVKYGHKEVELGQNPEWILQDMIKNHFDIYHE